MDSFQGLLAWNQNVAAGTLWIRYILPGRVTMEALALYFSPPYFSCPDSTLCVSLIRMDVFYLVMESLLEQALWRCQTEFNQPCIFKEDEWENANASPNLIPNLKKKKKSGPPILEVSFLWL